MRNPRAQTTTPHDEEGRTDLAVRIRLARVGATKRPSYRVVAIDSRRPRDGRSLEILGFYDPLTDPATVQLHADRVRDWIGRGATPSETVVKLLRQAGLDPRGQEIAAAAPTADAKPKPKPRARKATATSGAKATATSGAKATA
jgi:small subunit ribosomal protein S16